MRGGSGLRAVSLGLILAGGVASLSDARAQPTRPAAEFKVVPEHTVKSPDGKITVRQYAKISAEGDYTWQFWAHAQGKSTMLEPEQPDYPAGFRFTEDSRWLVRMQKTGSGEQSLYLYKMTPRGFVTATTEPFGDMAWAYFKSLPESRKVEMPDFHIAAGLLKGTDENYRWLGVKWPNNRYLVLSLSGDVEPNERHGQLLSVRGWRVRYDLQTGAFDVPPEFADHNGKAIAPDAR